MANPDLLLLHGALGSAAQFDALIPSLTAHLTCHTLDFLGHGLTPQAQGSRVTTFRIEDFAKQVLGWLDRQPIATIDVFGYSMGGYVALYLAYTQPERIGRILTLGTKVLWTRDDAAKEIQSMDPDAIVAKVPHFARTLEARHAVPWRIIVHHTSKMIGALGKANLLSEDVLRSIPHPVRIAVGDRDATVSAEEAVQVYRCLPKAQLQVLPGAPHPLEKVGADRLAALILDWQDQAVAPS